MHSRATAQDPAAVNEVARGVTAREATFAAARIRHDHGVWQPGSKS
jgi:hypothetical protein